MFKICFHAPTVSESSCDPVDVKTDMYFFKKKKKEKEKQRNIKQSINTV